MFYEEENTCVTDTLNVNTWKLTRAQDFFFHLYEHVLATWRSRSSLRTCCHGVHSRAALLSSEGATSPCPRPTPSALSPPEMASLRTRAMAGPLSPRATQRSPCASSRTCSRARMLPRPLRTRVRVQPWSWFSLASPRTAGRTCGWSSRVLSRRAFPTLWIYWNLPYMSQMWFQAPRKHPWTRSLTMAPTGALATRSDAERSSQEGEKGQQ